MQQLIKMLKELDIVFAYNHFAEGESVDTPYICFYLDESNNFCADGEVFFKISNVIVALYTTCKDINIEEKVETMLKKHGIFYVKNEFYIAEEEIYEIQYIFDIKDEEVEENDGQ